MQPVFLSPHKTLQLWKSLMLRNNMYTGQYKNTTYSLGYLWLQNCTIHPSCCITKGPDKVDIDSLKLQKSSLPPPPPPQSTHFRYLRIILIRVLVSDWAEKYFCPITDRNSSPRGFLPCSCKRSFAPSLFGSPRTHS